MPVMLQVQNSNKLIENSKPFKVFDECFCLCGCETLVLLKLYSTKFPSLINAIAVEVGQFSEANNFEITATPHLLM